MRQRRRDEGGSEGRSVMDRIEGESSRTTSPHRESGLTSLGCSVTREPWPTDSGRQAEMSAAEMLAGAAPGRTSDWHSYRLEEGLAYGPSAPGAYREGRCKATASRE